MSSYKSVWIIVIIIIIIGIIFWIASSNKSNIKESFNGNSQSELDMDYKPNDGIQNLFIDQMTCSPDCCGEAGLNKLDNLTSSQAITAINNNLQTSKSENAFVRTNYTCGNGNIGSGCPCVTKDAYDNLVKRGQHNIDFSYDIDPTFLLDDINYY